MKVKNGFVEVEGHRLAYLAVNEHLASAEEPAIVFIHGVLASVNFWLDCVPPDFKENRAWYSLSLPAHHPSTVPVHFSPRQVDEHWFFRLMDGALEKLLRDRKAVVVGHSTGGFSALNLAIHQVPNVIGIVSVAGFHAGKWGGVEGQLLKLAALGKWAKPLFVCSILLARASRFVQRLLAGLLAYDRRAYRSSPLSQRMLENIRPNTSQQDPAALFALFNGISRLEIGHRLHEINVPCYIFAGTHDPVVPAEQSLLLAGEVPNAKTVVFRNVGHMPFVECPEAYFRGLGQALANIADGDDGRTNASV